MSILDYIKDIFQRPDHYTKFYVAFFGFGLSLLSTYFPEAPWLGPLAAFMTAIGVFWAPSKKDNK